jgi:ketosteroid isomerase-like protein
VPRSAAAAAALLALAACKVERTPPEFYSHPDPAVVDRQEAADEIRTRVRLFAEALGRADTDEAVRALAPDELAAVVGAEGNGGLVRFGAAGMTAAVTELAIPTPTIVRTPDLRVGASTGMGWFSTHLQLLSTSAATEPVLLRMSGVFARERGEWRLVEAHLSRPEEATPEPAARQQPQPSPPAGDSAAAPAAGG